MGVGGVGRPGKRAERMTLNEATVARDWTTDWSHTITLGNERLTTGPALYPQTKQPVSHSLTSAAHGLPGRARTPRITSSPTRSNSAGLRPLRMHRPFNGTTPQRPIQQSATLIPCPTPPSSAPPHSHPSSYGWRLLFTLARLNVLMLEDCCFSSGVHRRKGRRNGGVKYSSHAQAGPHAAQRRV